MTAEPQTPNKKWYHDIIRVVWESMDSGSGLQDGSNDVSPANQRHSGSQSQQEARGDIFEGLDLEQLLYPTEGDEAMAFLFGQPMSECEDSLFDLSLSFLDETRISLVSGPENDNDDEDGAIEGVADSIQDVVDDLDAETLLNLLENDGRFALPSRRFE